jgi:hypothetical protein
VQTPPDKLLDRVRKLLELSKSENANEAANAAAAAQRLMTEHAISDAMLGADEESDDEHLGEIGDEALCSEGAGASWRGMLAAGIADANQCQAYNQRRGREKKLRVVGHARNCSAVRYLFAFIEREIERLCKTEGVGDRVWNNNFKMGAALEVARRLSESAREARKGARRAADASDALGNGAALMRVDSALAKIDGRASDVEAYVKRELRMRSARRSSGAYDSSARAAGARAGASINLSGPRASLGAGSARLRP